jgi:hypothetical protein
MAIENPITIFESLLSQLPGMRNVHYPKASRDFYADDWTFEDVVAIEAEFARDLQAIAAKVEGVWGPPEFIGPREDSGFPDFFIAEELAYWRKGDVLAIIWWEHQDKEVPVMLVQAVLTPGQLAGD